MKKNALLLGFLLLPGLLSLAGDKHQLYRKSVAVGDVKLVKTDLSFFAGELEIGTETKKLSECTYGYYDNYIRPDVRYVIMGQTGYLTIKSKKEDRDIENKKHSNKWNLQLNGDVANELSVEVFAGEVRMNLADANLKRFQYNMMAGESNINLRNASIEDVDFRMTAGEANIDLSGRWKNDGHVDIRGGVGEITLHVPVNVGVQISVSGMLGEVDIPFFKRDGRTYTNDAFGQSRHTIYISIKAGIGAINVKLEE